MVTALETLIAADKASPKRLVILGDALHDDWIHGELLSSQDGCDKFVETHRCSTAGGAANAVNCLQHWHSCVRPFCAKEWSTKIRYIVDGRIVFRHDIDVLAGDCTEERELALAAVATADAVLLSDYDKGFLTEDFIQEVISKAKICIADAKRHQSVYRGALLKCNYDYALMHDCTPDVCTNGAGSPFVRDVHLGLELPDVKCVNHVGAGDCFSAHLLLALAHSLSLEDAATIAHMAGRAYVQHPRNRAPSPQELA